jgi:Tn3 transposase DDE domain
LKVADAVIRGRLSATTAIELQGAARDGDASFRAGHAHGLLLRTNDLLRSYTDSDYRREKLRYLNHNERTHQLQRQIRHAGSGSTRGRRQEELAAQSHCLALCTNLVMAYNTSACNAPSILGARPQPAKSMPRFSDSFLRWVLDISISTASLCFRSIITERNFWRRAGGFVGK